MKWYANPVVVDRAAIFGDTRVRVEGVELDSVLGSGANGFVFEGRDLRLKRRVAVKIWPPRRDLPRDRAGRAREEQAFAEAGKVARLKHSQIASVYSAGRLENGWPYAVMEFVEGVPLARIRDQLKYPDGFLHRQSIWVSVHSALDAAEREGIYHGDLHDGNVLVRFFDATVIDFGTSRFAGRKSSLRRHARLVHDFAQRTFPEFVDFIPPLEIPKLVRPEYATYAEGVWVDASSELRRLDADFEGMSTQDLTRRLDYLASRHSTALIDMVTPIERWLVRRGVMAEQVAAYRAKATAEVRRRRSQPWPSGVGIRLRPVPPFVRAGETSSPS